MQLNFKRVQSDSKPVEVDTASSAYTVYIRKNIEAVQKEDPQNEGSTYTAYEYDEAKLTQQEYLVYLSDQASEEGNTATQLAIAELAEQIESNHTELQLAIAEMVEAAAENA